MINDEPASNSFCIYSILSSKDNSLSSPGSFLPTSDNTSNPSFLADSMHSNFLSWDIVVDPSDTSIASKPKSWASWKNSSNLSFIYASSKRVPPLYGVMLCDLYMATLSLIISCSCTIDVPHPNFK